MKPRPYQIRSIDAVCSSKSARIVLVLPTGAGKSITAHWISQRLSNNPLWIVHRRELADQAPGRSVTVQSLLRGKRPDADLIIWDECAHLTGTAEEWTKVARHYPRVLGLTATPERHDGAGLGEYFQELIVGATYSELIAAGHILEPRVVRPTEELQGLAQDPAQTWINLAKDRPGFAFFSRVESAFKFAVRLNELYGHDAGPLFARNFCEVITGETPRDERKDIIDRFRAGELQVLSSVGTLTEGVDIPRAEICLVARGCQHAGAWLQIVGRVLRPFEGKGQPLVIDLPGVSHRLGLPHEDREYSLEGRAIRRQDDAELVVTCAACGAVYRPADHCPECGFVPPPQPIRTKIWGRELVDASAEMSPKERGIMRWRNKMGPAERRAWYLKKQALGKAKGYKPKWAMVQYKMSFGEWPRR